ncbi:uncharacterized protein [Palaemon carinicauda]|uniref:uncharacterized protein n=1 Tax=Palaemon carinicauda TaxID=392227 RepID=UPI0035B5CC87
MLFSSKNDTYNTNVMHSAKLENLLNQVSKAIVKNPTENDFSHSDGNINYKALKNRINERAIHMMNLQREDYHADPLPTYNNYWLEQEDPHFAKQAAKEAAIPMISKDRNASNHTLGLLMSRADIARAFQDHVQKGGVLGNVSKVEGTLSNIHLVGSHAPSKQVNRKRIDRAMKEAWPRDAM